jgi:hypothetical protein
MEDDENPENDNSNESRKEQTKLDLDISGGKSILGD